MYIAIIVFFALLYNLWLFYFLDLFRSEAEAN